MNEGYLIWIKGVGMDTYAILSPTDLMFEKEC